MAEARTRSGTLNTVSHAEEYGRPVFAVPGSIYSPTSEGTNELLRTGRARALCTADDVLDTLHIAPDGTELVQEGVMLDELTPNARTVLAELGPKAQTADDLAAATGLAVQAVLALLQHGLCSPGGSAEHSHTHVPGPAGQFLRLQWSPAHRAWGAVAGA